MYKIIIENGVGLENYRNVEESFFSQDNETVGAFIKDLYESGAMGYPKDWDATAEEMEENGERERPEIFN